MNPHSRAGFLVIALCVGGTCPLLADDDVFFDPMDGTFALQAADRGLVEPPVPIYYNGLLIGDRNHQVIEAFDMVPGTSSYPLTFVDLAANMFLGTSIVGSPSYRTAGGLQYIPSVSSANVTTGIPERYRDDITAHFGTEANVSSSRTFPNDPLLGKTEFGLSVHFESLQDIPLAADTFVDNDRLRVVTFSSMFSSETQFDANLIRYEDSSGMIRTITLGDSTPRDSHLLTSPVEMGSWVELVKGPGSTWFPDSPTIRLDILNDGDLTLGLQGFLAGTLDPNDDSLSVWLEVLGAPNTLTTGTTFDVDFRVTASVPEPSALSLAVFGTVIGLFGYVWRHKWKPCRS
jgi:hypothetical protein